MTEYLTDDQMGKGKTEYLTGEQMSGAAKPLGFLGTAADVGKSFGAGALRGTAGLADLPGDLSQLVSVGSKYLTGYETPKFDTSFREGMSEISGGFSERKPETTLGRYAGTVGEFAPAVLGASLTGGGSLAAQGARAATKLATQAVIPGVVSEGLGQTFEDTDYEMPARLAGAILGGVGGNTLENITRGIISPGGAARATNLADARLLRSQGVEVGAGQATGSPRVQAIEARNPSSQLSASISLDSPQLKSLTTAALRKAGLTDSIVARVAARPDLGGADPKLASRPMLDELFTANGENFDNALKGIPTVITNKFLGDIRQAIRPFDVVPGFPRKTPPVAIMDLLREIGDSTRSGVAIPAARLQSLRSQLGNHLQDADTSVSTSAFELRKALDEAIDGSVQAVGQDQRMGQLLKAREEYRALLAIEEAVKRSKLGVNGIITPDALHEGVQSVQGVRATSSGRGMPLANISDAAKRIITPLPSAPKGAMRKLMPVLDVGALGSAAFAGPQIAAMASGNPMLATILAGGAGTVAAADLARRLTSGAASRYANTKIGQRYLENQLVNPTSGIDNISSGLKAARFGAPSAMEEREGRKSGGRVSRHDADADQLVLAAERAKKGWSAETAPLLNQSDDAVAHALEVANRSI